MEAQQPVGVARIPAQYFLMTNPTIFQNRMISQFSTKAASHLKAINMMGQN
jgi:hypothetical protein